MSTWKIKVGSKSFDVEVTEKGYGDYEVELDGQKHPVTIQQANWGIELNVPGGVQYVPAGAIPGRAPASAMAPGSGRVAPDVKAKAAAAPAPAPRPMAPAAPAPVLAGNAIVSPMPGRVIRLHVKQGQEVKAGDPVAVLESMKMENTVIAPRAGRIAALHVKIGDTPNTGHPIATYE